MGNGRGAQGGREEKRRKESGDRSRRNESEKEEVSERNEWSEGIKQENTRKKSGRTAFWSVTDLHLSTHPQL